MTRPRPQLPFAQTLLLTFGALTFGWQIWGLRYTNQDDILYNLYAALFTDREFDIVAYIAQFQARVQAYINIPIYLAMTRMIESPLYDVLNVGSILACYGSLLYVLTKLGPTREASSLLAALFLLFPLHYYYTFPQGYPVMGCWALTLAFTSAGLLASYLQGASHWALRGSVLCPASTISSH